MPVHTAVFPEIAPGCAGVMKVIVTAAVVTVLLPQPLFALTESEPLEVPVVTLIVLLTDVPVHPDGKVHV